MAQRPQGRSAKATRRPCQDRHTPAQWAAMTTASAGSPFTLCLMSHLGTSLTPSDVPTSRQ